MKELKEGQKVRVNVAGLKPNFYDGLYLTREMVNIHGVLLTIKKQSSDSFYRVHENHWSWRREWLQPVEETAEIKEEQPVTAHSVLLAASQHMIERGKTYDKEGGERSMGATVKAFESVTGVTMTEAQGWLFMALLKAVRANQRQAYHADSFEDMAAYVGLAAEAKAHENE